MMHSRFLCILIVLTAIIGSRQPLFASTDPDKAGISGNSTQVKSLSALELALQQTTAEVNEKIAKDSRADKKSSAERMPLAKQQAVLAAQEPQATAQMPPFYVNPISQTVRMVREQIRQIQSPAPNNEATEAGMSATPVTGRTGDAIAR